MRTDRRFLADRVRKIGVAIQGVMVNTGNQIRTGMLAVTALDGDTLLDAAQTLDVIAQARALLPARIPRADMLMDPAGWVVDFQRLLDAIDSGVVPKQTPCPVTAAEARRAAGWAQDSHNHHTAAQLLKLADWLDAGRVAAPAAEPESGQVPVVYVGELKEAPPAGRLDGITFRFDQPGTYQLFISVDEVPRKP